MTIFRSRAILVAIALAGMPAESSANPSPAKDQCGNISPQRMQDCVKLRIQAKEQQLVRLYPRALAAVEKGFKLYGAWDNRTHSQFLKRSQAQWKRFVEDDCTLKAAFGGGSNSAISDRLSGCYETELDRRIEFLEQLANGSYGRG